MKIFYFDPNGACGEQEVDRDADIPREGMVIGNPTAERRVTAVQRYALGEAHVYLTRPLTGNPPSYDGIKPLVETVPDRELTPEEKQINRVLGFSGPES